MDDTTQGMLGYYAVLLREIRPRLQLGHVWGDLSKVGRRVECHLPDQSAEVSCARALVI